ncbi:hypothetical protein LIER_22601 [Lithospermum erythrorhizon]|uniref:Uncharacterized protein n=1 Tax=Lithospermum erythrorhizon TaxID=34254 RepID=A0AAV3QYN6_LITER
MKMENIGPHYNAKIIFVKLIKNYPFLWVVMVLHAGRSGSGWSDDQESEGKRFSLLEGWKLVCNQPRYSTRTNESESSGSKRKSGGDDNEFSIPAIVCSEGRDATKKTARASSSQSSTAIKSKESIDEELSNLAYACENLEQI